MSRPGVFPSAQVLLTAVLVATTLTATGSPAGAVTYADRTVRSGEGTFTVAIYESPQPGRTRPGGPMCTGALLSDRVVVTAAHCLDDLTAENIAVGQPGAAADPQKAKTVPVIGFKVHESYRPGDTGARAGTNDLALLLLAAPMGGTRVLLPTQKVLTRTERTKLSMYGYGLDEKGRPASGLRMATVRDMTTAVATNPPPYRYDLDNLIPAGGYRQKLSRYAGACTGDSGGPLVLQEGGRTYLIGVTSYVFANKDGGCDASFASSFLRVSAKSAWIAAAQRKLMTDTRTYRLVYRGDDPAGDGTNGNLADLTSLTGIVTHETVVLEAAVTPRHGDTQLSADVSMDSDGDRVADLKAFAQGGVVTDVAGQTRCNATFSTDRKIIRWVFQRSCFRGEILSLALVATENGRGLSGSDTVTLSGLSLPQR
jgi:secreted trypsin-like serine protease